MMLRFGLTAVLALVSMSRAMAAPGLEGVPAYGHIVVIEMENRQYGQIIDADPPTSPGMTELAHQFGVATNYYGISHVSQPNYIAFVSGDQQGITDDDPWYCDASHALMPRDRAIVAGKPDAASMSTSCEGHGSASAPYTAHHFSTRSLFAQLNDAGISWSMFNQTMPLDPDGTPHPEVAIYPDKKQNPDFHALYVSKHNPADNFDNIRSAPDFLTHNRTEQQFLDEAAAGTLPRFSYFIPDLCHDDHGASGPMNTAPQCRHHGAGPSPLLTLGDQKVQQLVEAVRHSPLWNSAENVAVVVTFDEDDYGSAGIQGCCGYHPVAEGGARFDTLNQGGGHIPTIVITNHGAARMQDATPYNHYSLLRTVEDAFGIAEHLGHAADIRPVQPADGSFVQTPVLPMVKLFSVQPSRASR